MASNLKSLTVDQLTIFDANANKKNFRAPEPLIIHLMEIRPKLSAQIGVSPKDLQKTIEYVRFYRAKMIDSLPMITHMASYHKETHMQIDALKVIIELLTTLLARPYVKPLIIYEKPEKCPICLDSLRDQVNPLSCGHWAHKVCMQMWDQSNSKTTCTVCKKTNVQYTE
jgi:hypothetical protein